MPPRKWFYVRVVGSESAPASFTHSTVYATTEEGAYQKGQQDVKERQLSESTFVNDYVIPVNG